MGTSLTSEQAIKELMDGNKRYVDSRSRHPNQTPERRLELRSGQNPFAAILGCSDSRIPPEVIFDQGLGDLFVIRVAGNVAGKNVVASIEYAVAHLHVPLVVVLGHSNCGAVTATSEEADLEGHMPGLASAIRPALESVKGKAGDLVDNAAKANATMVADQLKQTKPILSNMINEGIVKVISAFYDLDSGLVTIL